MAGAGRVRRSRRLREAPRLRAAAAYGVDPEEWRDWAGLPVDVLAKVASTLVAQTEAEEAATLMHWDWWEDRIQKKMAERKGLGLFVFALVCRRWRKAQLKVGGPLRTWVYPDVIMPGRVELAKWALAEGCPRMAKHGTNLAEAAVQHAHLELAKWLHREKGFSIDFLWKWSVTKWDGSQYVRRTASLEEAVDAARWGCSR